MVKRRGRRTSRLGRRALQPAASTLQRSLSTQELPRAATAGIPVDFLVSGDTTSWRCRDRRRVGPGTFGTFGSGGGPERTASARRAGGRAVVGASRDHADTTTQTRAAPRRSVAPSPDQLDVLDHCRGRHVARVDPRVHPDQGDRAVIDEAAKVRIAPRSCCSRCTTRCSPASSRSRAGTCAACSRTRRTRWPTCSRADHTDSVLDELRQDTEARAGGRSPVRVMRVVRRPHDPMDRAESVRPQPLSRRHTRVGEGPADAEADGDMQDSVSPAHRSSTRSRHPADAGCAEGDDPRA